MNSSRGGGGAAARHAGVPPAEAAVNHATDIAINEGQ